MKSFGIIMAGGGGTRFWPLSRKETPKQLLNLDGRDIMINEAIERLGQVVGNDNIFIVTNKSQAEKMEKYTQNKIKPQNILSEPSARNTAACIGYAAIKIMKSFGDGVMVITPSDAYIRDNKKFSDILNIAVNSAEESDKLVTIGITPTFAATGYGYIQHDNSQNHVKGVKRFVEKPDLLTAEKYIQSAEYVWNSGMFVWKVSVILEKFRKLLPDIYADLMTIYKALDTPNEQTVLDQVYPNICSISIDYGIMEKSDDILVIPGDFGWNDVGSWDMLDVLHEPDANGNVTVGDALVVDTKNTTVFSSDRLVAAVGVDDLVIVETLDAVMVCPKSKAQDVKKLVDYLKEHGRIEVL